MLAYGDIEIGRGVSYKCGFASHSKGNVINENAIHTKLSLVVQTAQKISSDA